MAAKGRDAPTRATAVSSLISHPVESASPPVASAASSGEHSYAQAPPPLPQQPPNVPFPNIKDVLSTHVPTVRHIPKSARGVWARVLTDVIYGVINNIASEQHWALLFAAPKCVLAAPKWNGNDHHHQVADLIKARAESWRKCEFIDLWKEVSAPLAPRQKGKQSNVAPTSQADQNRRRCLRLVQDGQFSRGIQALSSDGIDQSSASAFKSMQDKHPHADPPTLPTEEAPPSLSFDVKRVRNAVLSFKAGTAPGPSGLRAEHLKLALLAPTPARGEGLASALTKFVNVMASGKLPAGFAPFFCSANLFAARKKDGGHRPIAVGEVLRRLVSKCLAFDSAKKASEILSPLQVGVGVRGGVEAVIHAFRSTLDDNSISPDSKWILQLDFSNAFNTISREAVLRETRSLFPELAAWTESTYGRHSHLFFGKATISSSTGLHQGDPLAPLLYAISKFLICKLLSDVLELLQNVWFLDDGNLMGPLEALQQAYDIVAKEAPKLGLSLNRSKCSLWNPVGGLRTSHDDPLGRGVPVITEEGIELLGAPIGSPAFSNQLVTARIEKLRQTLDLLPSLEDSHVEYCLLRSCLSLPTMSYSMRTCPPNHISSSLGLFDGLMRDALGSILGVGLSDRAWRQASLPVSLGGQGLRQVGLHSVAAFSVSSMHSSSLVSAMVSPRAFNPDISHPLSIINDFSGKTFTCQDIKDSSQKEISHCIDLFSQKRLYNSSTGPRERARLGSVSLGHSGDWLNALPSKVMNLHMRPTEFRMAVKYRLGIQVFQSVAGCPVQECSQENDVMGDHAIGCGHSGERTSRHNQLRDTIFKTAASACLAPTQEIRGLVSGSEARPADVFIPAWDKGKDSALDVTVISPLQLNLVDRSAQNHNVALDTAFRRKMASAFQDCANVDVSFFPLAVETFGGWHPVAVTHLTRIGRALARQTNAQESLTIKHLVQRLSVSLQKANAAMILSRQTHFPERADDGD